MDAQFEHTALEIEEKMNSVGMTISQLIHFYSVRKSTLFNLSTEQYRKFSYFYQLLVSQDYSKFTKGSLLERISTILFQNSLFYVRNNCRTHTNELDLLIEWSDSSRLSLMNQVFSCFGDSFICECKNYSSAVSVTYVGKFFSLLRLARVQLGIMIAWEGVTGRNSWSDAEGLIRKIALSEHIFIVTVDQNDLQRIFEQQTNIFSLINDKYHALQHDIDYSKYIQRHPAEDELFKSQT